MVDGVSRVMGGLLSLLSYPLASLRVSMRQLVATFHLAPDNITFR